MKLPNDFIEIKAKKKEKKMMNNSFDASKISQEKKTRLMMENRSKMGFIGNMNKKTISSYKFFNVFELIMI